MYLFLGLAFGNFVGDLVTLDRQSKGIQIMACATFWQFLRSLHFML